ncbi:peptidase S1 [Verrucomicrobiota bacterium sgz303538]
MNFSKRWQFLGIASVLFFSVQSAKALIVYGSDTGGTTDNTMPPTNNAPWNYVASIDGNSGASGVYLGYGYVITANHVTGALASVSISGSVYAIDQSYTPLQIGGADIKLLRIIGDPGLAPITLIGANDDDTGKDATVIGWGVGKGADVTGQGWNWGDDYSRMERWGLNTTGSSYVTSGGLSLLYTEFNRPGALLGGSSAGADEATLSLGDSGGGLFIKYGNTWKLAGIIAGVDTFGSALYDKDAVAPFDQPERSFYTPVQLYRNDIIQAIPEPSAACLLLATTASWLGCVRRRDRK